MQARGQMMLLLPDLSMAEQAPDLTDMHIRQFIFPIIRTHHTLSPLHIYLAQYRRMALDHQIGTVPSDVAILKGYDWYTHRDPDLQIAATVAQQEQEFRMFVNLRSFGEVSFLVRFHTTDNLGNHEPETVRTLIISNRYVAVFDQQKSMEVMKGRPFNTIKHIGLKTSELRFTFEDNHEWYILNHRACEISCIVQILMQRRSKFRQVNELTAAYVPASEVLCLPDLITCPKSRVSAEELLPDLFGMAVNTFTKLAKKRKNGEIDAEYAMQELVFNSQLHKLDTVRCIDLAPLLDTPAPKIAPLHSFDPMTADLKAMNQRLFGTNYSGAGQEQFKRNLELLNSLSTPILAATQQSATSELSQPADISGEVQELQKQLTALGNVSDDLSKTSSTTTVIQNERTVSAQPAETAAPIVFDLPTIAPVPVEKTENAAEIENVVEPEKPVQATKRVQEVSNVQETKIVTGPIVEEPDDQRTVQTSAAGQVQDIKRVEEPIPVPQFYPQSPCPTAMPMYGYQPMPMGMPMPYAPGYVPYPPVAYPPSPASPSSTRIDASPSIIVNVGDSAKRQRVSRSSRHSRKLSLSSEDSASESESESESETETKDERYVDVDDMLAKIDLAMDDLDMALKLGKNPKRRLNELGNLAKSLEIMCDDDEKDVMELAQRIRKFCRVDRRRNIQIEVMKVLSSRLEEVCRVRRETKTRVIADNPGSSVFTTSAKVHPKASDTPCLQDALQKLQASLNCAHMQAATTMASQ